MSGLLTCFSVDKILKHNYGSVERSIEQVEWQIKFYGNSNHPVSASRVCSLKAILEQLKQMRK